jgi:hypothetical protein
MGRPGSELATWNWLVRQSALGELIDVDFATMSHMSLYRASDVLMKHREVIETRLFSSVQTLFDLAETVTLYDLTNTYFEGEVSGNRKARRGRSKEKRSDCPLVTLGLVLDGSGFVRRSQTFAGNVSEPGTLAGMLAGLGAPAGRWWSWMPALPPTPTSRGWSNTAIAIWWFVAAGMRQFDETCSVTIETAGEELLHLQKELSPDGQELCLYCHSPSRQFKEEAMLAQSCQRFEAGLQQMQRWAATSPAAKRITTSCWNVSADSSRRAAVPANTTTVHLVTDDSGKTVTGITWQKVPVQRHDGHASGGLLLAHQRTRLG